MTTQEAKLVDRYRIQKLLGKGRSGLVYLAHDEQLNQPVTAKQLHANLISGSEAYLAEARKVANLDNPSIAPVYDFGHGEECIFVISKYVEGADLRSYLISKRPTPVDSARLITTLAEALDGAHQSSLHHLTLRPNKILVDTERKPWVFARDFIREERFAKSAWIPGNPMYMSPEQVVGETDDIGHRSDIFSLGVVLYEMLTGHRPYSADGGIELCKEILNPKIAPPSRINKEVSTEFDRICARAMARQPEHRYQRMRDFAEDLFSMVA